MIDYLDSLSPKVFIKLTSTSEPDELKSYNARWYHMFWLLIPILGIFLFVLSIDYSK